jgi:uncharacterized protein YejL (UPF0352 family)
MKNLILITLLLVATSTVAQQTNDTKFQATYTIANAVQEDLFLLAYDWTSTFFTANGNTLISSKHSDNKLEGRVNLVLEKSSSDVDYSIAVSGNTCTIAMKQVSNPNEAMEQHLNALVKRFERVLQSQLSEERKAQLKSYQHKN